jgi:hypothetical protein
LLPQSPSGHSGPAHALLVVTIIVVPLFATLVMEAAEALTESLGWRIRLGRTGWDLCVLAVGLTGAVFTLPGVVTKWGPEWAVCDGLIALLIAVACGVFIIHLRKTKPENIKGWQSFLAVGLGLVSLALPLYFVVSA